MHSGRVAGVQKKIKMRADIYLSQNGYTQSRQRARNLIEDGCVFVDGTRIDKPSFQIDDRTHVIQINDSIRYVGRGGLKLEAALKHFAIDVTGMVSLDVGASTGGFTDCLLQHGATRVYAVDSGENQLAQKLLTDSRVISLEHYNARSLDISDLGSAPVDLIVMDVSFISATYILPRFPSVMRTGGKAIVLIKPQFEAGKAVLGKGGIVKDPKAHRYAIERVFDCARSVGLLPTGLIASPIFGGDGNREFLACFEYGTEEEHGVSSDTIASVTGARCSI